MKHLFKSILVMGALMLSSNAMAETYIVKMVTDYDKGAYYFEPKDLTIKSGDTVTWINVQDDMHNAVADAVPKGAEKFESPMLEEEGQSWSYTFTQSGTYSYHCHPHAAMGMVGTIIVDRPSTPDEMDSDGHGDHDHGSHSNHH